MSSSVKQQFIQDLKMAGLAPATQELYLRVVLRFVARTRIRPQDAPETYTHLTEPLREQLRPKLDELAAGLA